MENKLMIDRLTFRYHNNQSTIFHNLNYQFSSGRIVGIYGRNGSGKTTFINCISGYLEPTDGQILINEKRPDQCRSDIAIVPEEMDLIEYLTLEDNIRYFLRFYEKPFYLPDVHEFMHRYGLYEKRGHYVYEESKGILRKVQLVIAILMSPRLLLADEPLDGVDECSKQIFYEDTRVLSAERGTITIYSLHDERALKEYCNEIVYL